jgi:putative aldouronate transport system permease protein
MQLTSFKQRRVRATASTRVFYIITYTLVTVVAVICLMPFILVISGSLTDELSIRTFGYNIIPRVFSTEAYRLVFKNPEKIFRAYGISIFITATGTCCGLFLITMTAYVISRRSFKYRNIISFFFYFTTLFSGGMVSTYIFYVRYLHLKNNLLALILPGLFNVFYLLIMRSFVAAIPQSIIESAKIDGASEFKIFIRIVLPIIPSGLATIGLFMALGYWNDWYNAMLYINDQKLFPLQYMLYDMMMRAQALAQIASKAGIRVENMPTNSLKLAMAVVATGPIILFYPFVQKYFIKGVTIGSVKG